MPFYHRLGDIPRKRHTQFRKPDGELYKEELMGTRGFSGIQSILYRLWEPTRLLRSEAPIDCTVDEAQGFPLEPHHLATGEFNAHGDAVSGRVWLLTNAQTKIGLATPTEQMRYFYRNGGCDELLFVHTGHGTLRSQFGSLPYRPGDYIVLPVGTTWQLHHDTPTKLLVVESHGSIDIPRRYRNEYGQCNEFSPFCERDIRVPEQLETHDERGEFEVQVQMGPLRHRTFLDHHPFDVIGWDGFLYPWAFNIEDFEPITGRVHQPPPVHQTFAAPGFVVCSFVPRLYDYHPTAVPVPYNHSNVHSDEVLYYVDGEFMSRKGVNVGSITHHPAGLPHGPHPGTVEASLGKRETKELAVMIDTFAPLSLTAAARRYLDPNYLRSWIT